MTSAPNFLFLLHSSTWGLPLLSPLPLIPWKNFSLVLEDKNTLQMTPNRQLGGKVLCKTKQKKKKSLTNPHAGHWDFTLAKSSWLYRPLVWIKISKNVMWDSMDTAANWFPCCSFYTWLYFHTFLFYLSKAVVCISDSQEAVYLRTAILKILLLFWQTRNIPLCF